MAEILSKVSIKFTFIKSRRRNFCKDLFLPGYQLEKRLLPRGDWKPASNSLIPGLKATISNVDEGMTYEFRVCAVNDGGPGAYAQLDKPHTVKDMICK